MAAYGNVTKALQRIRDATTPDRFTLDFLEAKIGLKGGSARPVIPFLKRTGFLNSDGSPTDLYVQFRNSSKSGGAAAAAMKRGYSPLYEIHEYAHDLQDKELRDVIIQATGWDASSSNVKSALGSFKALREFADFDAVKTDSAEFDPITAPDAVNGPDSRLQPSAIDNDVDRPTTVGKSGAGIKLGYTINLNLPPTTDIAVFNAIFKSLKEHLL